MKFYLFFFLMLYGIYNYSSEGLPRENQCVRDFLTFVRQCRAGTQLQDFCRVERFGDLRSEKAAVCIYSNHLKNTYCMSSSSFLCFTSNAQPDDFAGTPLAPMLQFLHERLKTPGDSMIIFVPGLDQQVLFEKNRTMNEQPGSFHFTGIISPSDGVRETRTDLFLE